jgi:Ca-activated chloride channel family protein
VNFLWPQGLWLLLIVPASVAGYWLVVARRKPIARLHPGLFPIGPRRIARHLAPALFALSIALLLTAAARPTTRIWVPAEAATVVLAIDVSASMRAPDVDPTRLGAAQAAARDFVRGMPPGVSIGIVTFSTEAHLLQPPVREREKILNAIDLLAPEEETAIGSGLLASLDALYPEGGMAGNRSINLATAVILLTDGQNSHGPDPIEAAKRAAGLGVRVYTIGIGTAHGRIRDERGWSTVVGIDEESLKEIASLTGAEYSYAQSAWHLKRIYARLGGKVVLAKVQTEVAALLCAAAALIALLAATFSLLRTGRLL